MSIQKRHGVVEDVTLPSMENADGSAPTVGADGFAPTVGLGRCDVLDQLFDTLQPRSALA